MIFSRMCMELEAKIIELDKNRNNVVLSRRAWLEQTQSEVRQNSYPAAKGPDPACVVSSIATSARLLILAAWTPGARLELSGSTSTTPPRLSRLARRSPARCSMSTWTASGFRCHSRRLRKTRGRPLPALIRSVRSCRSVTKLVPFGAFVRVEEGIEGLVHVSELAERMWRFRSRLSRSTTT